MRCRRMLVRSRYAHGSWKLTVTHGCSSGLAAIDAESAADSSGSCLEEKGVAEDAKGNACANSDREACR